MLLFVVVMMESDSVIVFNHTQYPV